MLPLISAWVVQAATITYSALGRFDAQPFALITALPVGGGSLTFTGLGSTTASEGVIGLGSFDSKGIGAGGTVPAGSTFDLQVTQTAPGPSAAFTANATISGAINTSSSGVVLLFSNPSFTLNGVSYTIDQTAGGIAIAAPGSNGGLTPLDAAATSPTIPEPATYFLFGTGLWAFTAFAIRRRRRSQKQKDLRVR